PGVRHARSYRASHVWTPDRFMTTRTCRRVTDDLLSRRGDGRADVVDDDRGRFCGCEVSARRVLPVVDEVVVARDGFAVGDDGGHVDREVAHARWRRDDWPAVVRRPPWIERCLPVVPNGRHERLRGPIDRQEGAQVVPAEAVLELPAAVAVHIAT